jgi:hypothetical protein
MREEDETREFAAEERELANRFQGRRATKRKME